MASELNQTQIGDQDFHRLEKLQSKLDGEIKLVGEDMIEIPREEKPLRPGILRSKQYPHELKTHSKYFFAVRGMIKPFECRKNDRGFKIGDLLILREWDVEKDTYSGEFEIRFVSYILEGEEFGVKAGYCVLGLRLPTDGDVFETAIALFWSGLYYKTFPKLPDPIGVDRAAQMREPPRRGGWTKE